MQLGHSTLLVFSMSNIYMVSPRTLDMYNTLKMCVLQSVLQREIVWIISGLQHESFFVSCRLSDKNPGYFDLKSVTFLSRHLESYRSLKISNFLVAIGSFLISIHGLYKFIPFQALSMYFCLSYVKLVLLHRM